MQLKVSTTQGDVTAVAIHPGDTLAQAVYLSGAFAPRPLCSGLGKCGLCRVRFLSAPPVPTPEDDAILGSDAVSQGWRLGCRHKAVSGAEVLIPSATNQNTNKIEAGDPPPATPEALLLAVDLGTTSLAWSALEPTAASKGSVRTFAQGRELNPQIGAGSDVLSRLSAAMAPGGGKRLQEVTLNALRRIVAGLPAPISRICLAANTAMTALTRGASVLGLAAAPYSLEFHGQCEESLPGLPPVYFPPQAAPFIGGDIGAGMAALLSQKPEFPFLLADMGTNGEFVLTLSPTQSLAVSVPLGPALEGIGLSCGALAFDTRTRTASVNGQPLTLTRKETGILEYLMVHQGRPVSQEELIDHVWDNSVDSFSNSIRVHISALRKKLRTALGYDPIRNRIGEGYLMGGGES